MEWTATLLSGFSDVENDPLSVVGLAADHAAIADNGDGTYTVTPAKDYNGSLTLTWSVSDGVLSVPASTSVAIAAVNDAPVVANAGNTVTFTENGAAVTVDAGLTVTDVDSLNLSSASVTISNGFVTGDVLSATTTGTSVTASYDAANHRLNLTGSDTLAHYQTVLRTVTYTTSSDNPTNFGSNPTRTVDWSVSVANHSGRPSYEVPYCSTVIRPGWAAAVACNQAVRSS